MRLSIIKVLAHVHGAHIRPFIKTIAWHGLVMLTMLTASGSWAIDSNTLPMGGQVTSGTASISTSGNSMTIDQKTDKMVAEWSTFNIGTNASVAFNQPGSSSIALNRISDQSASQILGSLTANGQVFLINPAGVIFGSTATVNVGGLVASTLDISDTDFLSGNYTFTGSSGSITNNGNITGGHVAFISPVIENSGTITADNGTVLMAAGNRVSLDFTGDGLVSYTVDKGAIDALVENKGLIQADGGVVIMTAEAADDLASAVVNNEGVIQARTLNNVEGRILLLSDMDTGETIVGGTLDASAPNGGDGGFIETSAATVTVADDHYVTTLAAAGDTGEWLIDPLNYTIAASGGDRTGASITADLATTNVTIETDASSGSEDGDIFVNDSITWTKNTLTLSAYRNIEINSELYGSGTAGLALYYGQGATDGVISGTTAVYSINAPVNLASTGSFSTRMGTNGTVKDYTIITSLGAEGSTTGADLQGINGNLSGYYVLGANIDASDTSAWNLTSGTYYGFNPIGAFSGVFDGLGHTITDLYINRSSTYYVGLFGHVSYGSISNVGLIDESITGYNNVGGLVGRNDGGYISHSYATGEVTGSNNVGGLVGLNEYDGSIFYSYAAAEVNGSAYVGGLTGYNIGSTISYSYATGEVNGNTYVGGLAGTNQSSGAITYSYAMGKVNGNTYVGGLVGSIEYIGSIGYSYATGEVIGSGYVGGLVGIISMGNVYSSFWDTSTTGQSTSAGGTGAVGKTTSELMTRSTYTDAGWDFTNDWYMIDGQTRPFLRSEYSTTITNSHQLQLMALDLSASYTMGNDIDMSQLDDVSGHWLTSSNASSSGYGFVPIGDSTTKFTGSLDGQGYTITGLVVNWASTNFAGLFGYVDGGSISNVGLIDESITGYGYVGGLVGLNSNSSITNSYAGGTVNGDTGVGGLVGVNSNSSITNSYATSNVTGTSCVGGLVGANSNSSVTNSYAGGTVNGTVGVGGLVGLNESSGSITNSYATGNVTGTSAHSNAGGLVGWNNSSSIIDSYATGKVTGDGFVGGLVGYNYNSGSITNSYATGDVTGTGDDVGGLVGSNESSSITSSYARGKVTGTNYVGGLVGYNDNSGSITSSYATGDITGTNYVGGLVGYNLNSITNSYANGTVNGSVGVGGLVGYNSSGSISYSYAGGTVNGVAGVGGLVGYDDGIGSITDSFWDRETTGQSTSAGSDDSCGLTTEEMKSLSTYSTWSIDDEGGTSGVWRIYDGYTYPLLRCFLTQATATVTADSKTYDGTTLITGGSYAWTSTVDTSYILGTAAYEAESEDAGAQDIILTGLYSSQDGYDISYTGTVDIGKASLTITANGDARIYDGSAYTGGNGVTYSGFVSGEDASVLSGSLSYGGTSQGAINAGTYTISISGLFSGNYEIVYVDGTLAINPSPLDASYWIINAIESDLLGFKARFNGTAQDLGITGSDLRRVLLMGPGAGSYTLEDYGKKELAGLTGEED